MTTVVQKTKIKEAAAESTVKHPLLQKPIPHAYALIPNPERPGLYFAVHLTNVFAEELEHLEPNGRSAAAAWGMLRIGQAMEKRHLKKAWG